MAFDPPTLCNSHDLLRQTSLLPPSYSLFLLQGFVLSVDWRFSFLLASQRKLHGGQKIVLLLAGFFSLCLLSAIPSPLCLGVPLFDGEGTFLFAGHLEIRKWPFFCAPFYPPSPKTGLLTHPSPLLPPPAPPPIRVARPIIALTEDPRGSAPSHFWSGDPLEPFLSQGATSYFPRHRSPFPLPSSLFFRPVSLRSFLFRSPPDRPRHDFFIDSLSDTSSRPFD